MSTAAVIYMNTRRKHWHVCKADKPMPMVCGWPVKKSATL
jgi:hypothetical protein